MHDGFSQALSGPAFGPNARDKFSKGFSAGLAVVATFFKFQDNWSLPKGFIFNGYDSRVVNAFRGRGAAGADLVFGPDFFSS